MSEVKSIIPLLPLHFFGRCVRTHTDDLGVMWWVAQDVGDVIGVTQVRKNLRTFPADEKGVITSNTLGGAQPLLTVNEPGLYRLIFLSRKPEAERFKRMVFHEVLPALRQTGRYMMLGAEGIPSPERPGGFADKPAAQMDRTLPLPAPQQKIREHAEISIHLVAVWRVIREATTPLDNREIAQQAGIALRTATAHTRYLMQLGFLRVYEAFPRHLYKLDPEAQQHSPGYWHRLEELSAIMEARRGFSYDDLRLFGKD